MAATTVTGSVGGTPIAFNASTAIQAALAQQILASATSLTATVVTGSTATTTTGITIDISQTGSIVTGSSSATPVQVLLDGQFGTFITGGAPTATTSALPTIATVVAADGSNSSVLNANPVGALFAVTGSGGNTLLGLAGQNAFTTGIGGQDIVVLNGAANTLTSNGSDAILVGGPSTITAAANGVDNILMTAGTSLAFINGSKAGTVDSISGASGATVVVAGTGATSVTSGAGPEAFFVDTSVGNVTLNAGLQTNDTFEFVKDANAGTASAVVNNFATGDNVFVHGYTTFGVTAAAGNAAGSVLVLSDGSSVTFSNVSVATLSATVKVV